MDYTLTLLNKNRKITESVHGRNYFSRRSLRNVPHGKSVLCLVPGKRPKQPYWATTCVFPGWSMVRVLLFCLFTVCSREIGAKRNILGGVVAPRLRHTDTDTDLIRAARSCTTALVFFLFFFQRTAPFDSAHFLGFPRDGLLKTNKNVGRHFFLSLLQRSKETQRHATTT